MNQETSHEVQVLEALLLRKKQETDQIMAQLDMARSSMSGATAGYQPALTRPSITGGGRSRSNTIPHNANNAAVKVESVEHEASRPMKRSKTTHSTVPSSTATMMRSCSSASKASVKPAGFASTGPVHVPLPCPPSTHHAPLQTTTGSSLLSTYLRQDQFQQPANPFIHAGMLLQGHPPAQTMQQFPEGGREFDVSEFLSMRESDEYPSLSPIPIASPGLLSPHEITPYSGSGIESACGSLTSGPSIGTAPMSRSNSAVNDNASISGQFHDMVRIQSQQSTHGGFNRRESFVQGYNFAAHHPSLLGKRPASELTVGADVARSLPYDRRLFSAMANPMLNQHVMKKSLSQASEQSTSSAGVHASNDPNAYMVDHLSMERSLSKDSIKSNSSLKFRAKEALTRQNVNASRQLQPKPAIDVAKKSSESLGNKKDGKAAITKAKYERPKHPKVRCEQCNEYPEGFRGEHELRRHIEAKHKSMIRKWICRDPAEYGIPHLETAIKPLKECKQCAQNKQYGAYYNAAAHLRRTHFKIKPRKVSNASKNGTKGAASASKPDEEKRGGKGGGDWPAMSELKLWMIDVMVPMDQEGALAQDGGDDAVDGEEMEVDLGATAYGQQPGCSSSDAFNMAAFVGVGAGFNQDLDVIDPSMHGFAGDLGPMYSLDASGFHGLPISSSGFSYTMNHGHPAQHNITPSMMSIDTAHGYTSPLSSTATITQGIFTEFRGISDISDMSFDLTFSTGGH